MGYWQQVVLCQAQLLEAATFGSGDICTRGAACTTKEAYRLRIRELAPMITACADP
jgi:hypothetical protein